MATQFFADRGFLTINGIQKINLKSIKWSVDNSVTRVETMTADHSSAGFKRGNRKCSGSFELEVPDTKAEMDLSFLYGQDISIVCQLGTNGERWTLSGIVQTTQELNGSVGETSKSISFEARTATNENGPGVNAQIGF